MLGVVGRVCGDDDRGGLVPWAPGEPLPELFGEEGHEGVDHGEAAFEGGVEGVFCRVLFLGGAVGDDGFRVFDVGITEVGVPVLVSDVCGGGELTGGEGGVNVAGGGGEFVEDPAIGEGGSCWVFLGVLKGGGSEGWIEFAEDVFGGLVDFVAEAAVAVHYFDVKVDVAA